MLKRFVKDFLFFYLPLALWMGIIFGFSSMSGYTQRGELTWSEWLIRKGAHVGEYTILAFFMFRVMWRYFWKEPSKAFLLTAFFSLTFAVSDELHQHFVPLRQGKPSDILIDGIGISLMLLVFFVAWKMSQKREK